MKFVFRLVVFSILLNIATGVLINTVVDADGDKIFDGSNNIYLGNNPTFDNSIVDEYRQVDINQTSNPTSVAESIADSFYQLLDKIGISYVWRFISFVGDALYGFPIFIKQIVGKYFAIEAANFLFDILIVVINISYTIAIYMLWSGRDFFR